MGCRVDRRVIRATSEPWRHDVGRVGTSVTQDPTVVYGAIGLGALAVAVPMLWRWTQLFSTFVHESGHAFMALLTGRAVEAVRIFRRGGGCTLFSGARGPADVLVFAAGYSAPPLTGLGLIAAVDQGIRPRTVLLVVIFLVVVMVTLSANVTGFVIMALTLGALALLLHRAGPVSQLTALLAAAWFLILAGLYKAVELFWVINQTDTDDASTLAKLTGIPAEAWVTLFCVLALGCAYQAGRLLLA